MGQRALFKFISIIVSVIGISLITWIGTPYILGKAWQELEFGEYMFVLLIAFVILSVISFLLVIWAKASIRRGVEIG